MFHSGAQMLIDRWSGLPGAGLPHRADFQPMVFGRFTAQLFVLQRGADGGRFRLAGAVVERLHGRDLKGLPFAALFRRDGRALVEAAVQQAFREGRPVVLAAEAARLTGSLEVALAPLRGPGGAPDQLVGLYQPVAEADRNAESVGPLEAVAFVGVGAPRRAPLALAAVDGRRVA